ncbi:MAG: hypothetical protein JWM86_638 [Thermoleophilia bacterium]|nr:hypothetical protein [Thermoleophilia bacterium]
MNCPDCAALLVPATHETVEVSSCTAGHGLFLSADALKAALADRTDDRPADEERAAEQAAGAASIEALEAEQALRACPVCRTEMARRTFAYESGVPIDVCADHGIWLDAGELQRIEAWYEAQEGYRAADRAEWGGQTGRLEQIEQEHERRAADETGAVHWGPVGWFARKVSYSWSRRDD